MGRLGVGKKYLEVITHERRTDVESQRERRSRRKRRRIPK